MSVQKPEPAALEQYKNIDNTKTLPAPGPGAVPMTARQAAIASDSLTGIPVGAVKGLASTGYTIAKLLQKGGNLLSGQTGGPIPDQKPEILNPAPNEKLGYGGEQAAEFIAPGGLTTKLGKLGEAGLLASKLGNGASTIEKAPLLARTMLALGKGGLEAASAGGVEGLHGGTPSDIARTAGTAGAVSTAGDLLPLAANAAKQRAVDLYQKALAPTKQTTKFLTENKVVPGLLQRGEFGTLKGLSAKAENKMADVGDQMNTLMAARGSQTMNTKPILDSLEKVKQGYIVNGVRLNEDAIRPIEDMQSKISKIGQGNQISYDSLRKAKQIFDNPVAAKGGYAGVSVADKYVLGAQKAAANSIRSELAKVDPDMAKLNAEYSFWSNVGDVVDSTISRRVGQQGGLLGSGTAEVLGAAARGIPGAAVGTAAQVGRMASTSAGVRTFRSVGWNKLGNALANKDFPGMMKIAARLAAAATSTQSTPSRQQ
jgi:hypothetical protein